MHAKRYHEINQIMHTYKSKGSKSIYKRRQMKRLIDALKDIFKHESTERIEAIGWRQLTGFWNRNTDSDRVRYEKYLILREFFSRCNAKVTVPKPKVRDLNRKEQ